jgi:hypothetical protein
VLSVVVFALLLVAFLWTRRRRRRNRLDARGQYAAERPLFSSGGENSRPVSTPTMTSIYHEGMDRYSSARYLHEMSSVGVAYTDAGAPMAHADMHSQESLLPLQSPLSSSSVDFGVPHNAIVGNCVY